MKVIKDNQLLDEIMEKEKLKSIFETNKLQIRLIKYSKGEMVHAPFNTLADLLFVINGKLQIYGIRMDGTKYAINTVEKGVILGEAEFCNVVVSPYCVEAMNEVLCLSLPIEQNREVLEQSPAFLRYLLKNCVEKLLTVSKFEIISQSLEEKVLIYLRDEQPNHTLSGINAAVVYFRCSRRQLQRVLVKLCEEGKIIKKGKGTYLLA